MDFLIDNIKNLAAHLRVLDKKAEKLLLSQLRQELSLAQDDNLALKLSLANLELCNGCFFNIAGARIGTAMSKKVTDKIATVLLQWLANNDYASTGEDEEAFSTWQHVRELAALKKVKMHPQFTALVDLAKSRQTVRTWAAGKNKEQEPVKKEEEEKATEAAGTTTEAYLVRRDDIDAYYVQ